MMNNERERIQSAIKTLQKYLERDDIKIVLCNFERKNHLEHIGGVIHDTGVKDFTLEVTVQRKT